MRMELKKIVFETSSLTYKIMTIRRFKTPMAIFFLSNWTILIMSESLKHKKSILIFSRLDPANSSLCVAQWVERYAKWRLIQGSRNF